MNSTESNIKIILLAGKSQSTPIVYNYLKNICQISTVILEDPPSTVAFIKNRIRKLGIMKVLGQILFQLTIYRLLKKISKKRVRELLEKFELNTSPIPEELINNIQSVNSEACIQLITNLKPDLIIVNGTRIISKKVLQSTKVHFVNTHMGITPKYRGVHGGYWALVNNDSANFGVTVHAVDAGIDTGKIINQKFCQPSDDDNFTTYPIIQLASGLDILKEVITSFKNNKKIISSDPKTLDSRLWYHPTAWSYIYNRYTKGIK